MLTHNNGDLIFLKYDIRDFPLYDIVFNAYCLSSRFPVAAYTCSGDPIYFYKLFFARGFTALQMLTCHILP